MVNSNMPGLTSGFPARERPSWIVSLSLVLIAMTAVGLRTWRLGERSLWFDEAFSWRLSRFGWGEMLDRASRDNNPPFYYAALKAWTILFGESTVALRSLSVASGAAACLAMYALMSEGFGPGALASAERVRRNSNARWLGLCTAALSATAVLQVRWGWEARMYALGAALAACSGWLLLRALNRGDRRSWVVYAASAIAFAYTHTYAIFSLAAQGTFTAGYLLFIRRRMPDPMVFALRRRAIRTGLFIIAAFLPWLPVLKNQREHVRGDPGWPIGHWSVPVTCFEMFVEPEQPVMGPYDGEMALASCGVLLLALLWRPDPVDFFLLLSAALPPFLAAVVSLVDVPIFHSHYLIFAHLFLLAALARLLIRMPFLFVRLLLTGMVVNLFIFADIALLRRLDFGNRPGVREAAAYIDKTRQHGEPIIVTSPYYYLPTIYHLRERQNCLLLKDNCRLTHYEGTAAIDNADYITSAELGLLTSDRAWAINSDSPASWGRTSLPALRGWWHFASRTFREPYYVQGGVQVTEYRLASSSAGTSGVEP